MPGKITAIILSAGVGRRMHSQVPKQYLDLEGMPVVARTIKAFEECPEVTDIILVAGESDIGFCENEIVDRYGFGKAKRVTPGGKDRGESVLFGLRAADPDTEIVLIHDGARPMIDGDTIRRAIIGARTYRAAVVGIPAKDTIKEADGNEFVRQTPDRSRLRIIQTPQAFEYRLILNAYEKVHRDQVPVTDDAMAAEYYGGVKVRIVEGNERNIKITTPEDLEIAKFWLKKRVNHFSCGVNT